MLYSVKELAALVGITRQRVNDLCNKGRLSRVNQKLDSEDPLNRAWINQQMNTPQGHKPIGQSKHREYIPVEGVDSGRGPEGLILTQLSTEQLSTMSKSVIDKLKSLEAMLKARQDREVKRRDLIERALVAQVFGELYQVDSNELKTLGSKISADVSGICDCDDPEKVLMVEQRIDGEIIKVLNHIKQIMGTALKNWCPK